MFVILADDREEVVGVADNIADAYAAGWDWLKRYRRRNWWESTMEAMNFENETAMRDELFSSPFYWGELGMDIIETKKV